MRTPCSLRGTKAASATFVKTRGDRDSPKGRTLYWYARPSNANRRNGLWRGRIDTWKYASFRVDRLQTNPGDGRTQRCVFGCEHFEREPVKGCDWPPSRTTHSCPLAREEGECNSSLTRSQPPVPSGDLEIEETALLSRFWVPLTVRPVAEKETKILRPALLRGREWCVHHLPKSRHPPSLSRPSQGRLLRRLPPALAGAWTGGAAALRPAPRRCLAGGCCVCCAGAAAGGRPRRRVDRGTAAGGRVEAAAARRGRMCRIASVCFCAAKNCWAKFSTASPNRPIWDTGAFRNRALSTSFMSARHSQRWRSWTTMVDIARPRDRAVTFVARSARSVAVRSSLRTPGSWPPSCRSLSALAWWTCNNAIACRAEAASPQAA